MITRVEGEKFLPFRERFSLNFKNRGVVMIRGDVRVSAATDSNGAGKTSIPSAVCFAYFGEDLLGRRGEKLVNRFTDGPAVVRVTNEDALGEWTVERHAGPSKLIVEGIEGIGENEDIKDIQKKIEQRLGFGLRTFKNAVVFGQGAFERFAQADQAEQMRMLDEIQGTDFKPDLERAKGWRTGLMEKSLEYTGQIEQQEIRWAALTDSIAASEVQRDGFEQSKREAIAYAESNLADATARRSNAERAIGEAEACKPELAKLRKAVAAANTKAADVTTELRRVEKAWGEAINTAKRAAGRLTDINERLDNLLTNDACPTCKQPVATRKAAIRKIFEPEIIPMEEALSTATVNVEIAKQAHDAVKADYEALPDMDDKVSRLAVVENALAPRWVEQRNKVLEQANIEMRAAEAAVVGAKAKKWTGANALALAKGEAERLVVSIGNLREKVEGPLKTALAMADYCIEALGDRGIRSIMVDGVADYINGRLAKHLEVLTCGEAKIRMSATTDLKKGGVKERISFRPEWTWGGEGAGSGSGGQDRRGDLAVFASVQDLSERAKAFPIKVFDEVFDALDGRGKELAVEWIRQQAKDRGTVLLITHSKEMEALVEPDTTWTVVMDTDGAHVEES